MSSFPALAKAFGEDSIRVGAIALDREHAIEMAGELLVASGRSTPEYTESMLEAVAENGPYIVIAPGIALAHGRPSEAVLEIGLSLVTLAEPVIFGNEANDPVRLVIGLCAIDHSSHIDIMAELATFLGDSSSVNNLLNAVHNDQIRLLF
ncbi:MAG: PTS sugar transporter subunit IIA [Rhodoluna sp.]|nr:PTS sugar transporter subunit IIA [Rhodoluna sp.]